MKKIKLVIYFIMNFALTFSVLPAHAETVKILGQNTNVDTLDGFVKIFINVAQWILGIVGSLTLLAFIYGGVLFLISAGNSETVTKAKQVIIGSVIGLAIVFTSYAIIQFVFTALGVNTGTGWSTIGWFGK